MKTFPGVPAVQTHWQTCKELREGDHRARTQEDVTPAANLLTAGDILKNQRDSC